jgi:hypothetical protein
MEWKDPHAIIIDVSLVSFHQFKVSLMYVIARDMESDPLDLWSRRGALICPHDLSDFTVCDICHIIKYDGSIDSVRDAPFDQLLIASPRLRVPTPDELPDIIKRMKGENALIELDSRTKFKKQRDFVLSSMSLGSSKDKAQDIESRPQIVHFKENLVKDRTELFPVVHCSPPIVETIQVDSTRADINKLRLCSIQTMNPIKVNIHIFKDVREAVEAATDPNTLISELLEAVISHKSLDRNIQWLVRWADEDDGISPDLDLPPISGDQLIASLNVLDLCICPVDMDSESSFESD